MDKITRETLTPAFILELFKKHGMKPMAGQLMPQQLIGMGSFGCCGMGVVALELGAGDCKTVYETRKIIEEAFGVDFVDDFECGFDDAMADEQQGEPYHATEGYTKGWLCGQVAAELLKD